VARCEQCRKRRVLDDGGLCRECRAEYFTGALCCRCELPLDPDGTCPNDRCPYYWGYQDEVVTNDRWPSEEEWRHIKRLRKRLGL
jgi:hypothetical protein